MSEMLGTPAPIEGFILESAQHFPPGHSGKMELPCGCSYEFKFKPSFAYNARGVGVKPCEEVAREHFFKIFGYTRERK